MISSSCQFHRLSFILLITITFHHALVAAIDHPEDYVNLLAGTFTDGNVFSTGNTLPLIGRPWGFNHWAPQTRDGNRNTGSWWFRGNDHQFTWFRCTHQPSPWIGDWGWFLLVPQVGNHGDRNPTMFWEPRAAVIKPHLFDALFRYILSIHISSLLHPLTPSPTLSPTHKLSFCLACVVLWVYEWSLLPPCTVL